MSNEDVKAIVNDPAIGVVEPKEPKGFVRAIRKTLYVTTDGEEFVDKNQAIDAQRRINVSEFITRHGSYGNIDNNAIVDHWDELKEAMGIL